jgi:hypothetical protein
MAFATRDFEGAVSCVGEKLFDLIGILRVAQAITEHDHAIFCFTGLPVVEEMVGGGEGEYVARVGWGGLFRGMTVRSGPD